MVSCKVTVEGEFWSEKMEDEGFSELLFSKTVGIPTLGIVRWEMVRKPLNLWGETQMILSQFWLSLHPDSQAPPRQRIAAIKKHCRTQPKKLLRTLDVVWTDQPKFEPTQRQLKVKTCYWNNTCELWGSLVASRKDTYEKITLYYVELAVKGSHEFSCCNI